MLYAICDISRSRITNLPQTRGNGVKSYMGKIGGKDINRVLYRKIPLDYL